VRGQQFDGSSTNMLTRRVLQTAIAPCCAASSEVLNKMRVLIDSDAFCKLAIGGVLLDGIALLDAKLDDCLRLPALPHMLRKRGKLRKQYGEAICGEIATLAESFSQIGPASSEWQDQLTTVDGIDVGEAQLFAVAAEFQWLVISGDKRALRTLKLSTLYSRLNGRVVCLETLLLALCEKYGVEEVQKRMTRATEFDTALKICFLSSSPIEGLRSYEASLKQQVDPLVLWTQGGTKDDT
jgi:hypothetical protein